MHTDKETIYWSYWNALGSVFCKTKLCNFFQVYFTISLKRSKMVGCRKKDLKISLYSSRQTWFWFKNTFQEEKSNGNQTNAWKNTSKLQQLTYLFVSVQIMFSCIFLFYWFKKVKEWILSYLNVKLRIFNICCHFSTPHAKSAMSISW